MKIARDAALFGELPRDFGLHLDAFDCGHDEEREVGGLQRRDDIGDEVGVARRVDDVDLDAVGLERGEGQGDGDVPPLLLGVEVADSRAVLDPAHAGDCSRGEQQGLGQRGLSGPTVADQRNIADLGARVRLHP